MPPLGRPWWRRGRRRRCRARNRPARCRRRIAELAIGRVAAPVLVAAVRAGRTGSRAGTIGTRARAHRKAAALLAQPGLRAGGGVEAERRAAGQRDGVDAARPSCAGSSSALSRVPGPPPRTSTRRDRGLVEQRRRSRRSRACASSAWPTRTPATSVMRFRANLASSGTSVARTIADQPPITSRASRQPLRLRPSRRRHASRRA